MDHHQKAVDSFEKAAEDAEDADIRAFAAKTLPSLQKRLDHAKTVRDALE